MRPSAPTCGDIVVKGAIADVAVPRLLLVAGRFGLYETSLVFCLAQNPKTRIDFADGLLRETES